MIRPDWLLLNLLLDNECCRTRLLVGDVKTVLSSVLLDLLPTVQRFSGTLQGHVTERICS